MASQATLASARSPLRLFWVDGRDTPNATLGKRLLWVLTGLAALGVTAGVRAFTLGHHVLGTTAQVPWGVLIATYVFFVVSSTGLCLVSSLGHVFHVRVFEPVAKRAILLALVTLLVGFAVIATELERPFLLLRQVVLTPNPLSPIWWMGTLYGLYMVFIAAELLFLVRGAHARARQAGILSLVAAVAAHSNLGAVFGLSYARSFWYGPLVPVYFIASALVCGASLLVLMVWLGDWFSREGALSSHHRDFVVTTGRLLALFIGIVAFFTVWKLLAGAYGGHAGKLDAVRVFVAGPLFTSFWFFEVFLGVVVPLVILLSRRGAEPAWVAVAAALPVLGMFVARLNFVYGGQMLPLRPAVGPLGEVMRYRPAVKAAAEGLAPYAPSWVELFVVIGAMAGAVVLFVVAARALGLHDEEA